MSTARENPPTTSASADSGARPKVLRRPQQFSRKPGTVEIDLNAAPIPASITPNRTPGPAISIAREQSTSWQEDSRFGIALIFGVVLVNTVLGLILPLMHKPQPVRQPATTFTSGGAAMPSPTAHRGPSDVTIYTGKPSDDHRSMSLDTLPEDYNQFSVHPHESPIPTARSMQAQEQ